MKFLVCSEETGLLAAILKEARAHAKIWNASLDIVKTVTRELAIRHSRILEMEKELEITVSSQIEDHDVAYNVQLLVTSLEPGEKIVKYAEEEEIDLIFLGIKRRSKVGKLFFGSTAQYIILQASCPVVTVKV
jgi:nucleotide-binding universal stress UspA family protein